VKSYPSIPKFLKGLVKLHTFDKLDGSNLRFEWTKKRGWFKFGTRRRLFDETDPQFGEAIPIFHRELAEPLAKICVDNRWEKVVVFAEFWGKESFAGYHVDGDPKRLTVFDVSIHRKGILPPREFLKVFGDFGPEYLGEFNWTPGFIDRVRQNEVAGVTFEGVVGKNIQKSRIVMYKAKTQQWIDKVKAKLPDKAQEIISS